MYAGHNESERNRTVNHLTLDDIDALIACVAAMTGATCLTALGLLLA